ncbi:FAD-binding oxidoreductase [Parafrigoribacterium mesophilum]|uniref:FAD-binding oxidoreductase n=1 Tax=Parafrigoribacterium mesophilum TaxID=433646 RepID=UPI0031FD30AD
MTATRDLVTQLLERFGDKLLTADHPDYDAVRTGFYGGVDRRPAAIVRAATVVDVATTIALVRDAGARLAVRGGGHSLAHHSASDGGIVLDLSAMKAVDIDARHRTAWAEAGLTAAELLAAVSEQGLVVGFGDSGSVGIAGITLGGGIGYLSRLHGLTIDNVLAADVVTADGELLRADVDSNPDLYWAIRGGGGNFGVVTRLQYRLHQLPSVLGGILILPATPAVIAAVMAHAQAAPDELSLIVNVMVAPPMPFLPPEVHGKLIVMAIVCYAGDSAAGERAIAPLRAIAPPLVDMVHPSTYPELFPPEPEAMHPVAATCTMFLDHVDEDAAAVIIDQLTASDAAMAAVNLRALGGAIGRVATDETAFAHRDRRILANVAALTFGPDGASAHQAWASELADALRDGDNAAYVNFVGEADAARVHDVYPPATWDRLAAIKQRYDPTNFFRGNHNIVPAL